MRPWFAGWGFRAGAQPPSFASCWEQACQQLAKSGSAPGYWTFALLESKSQTLAAAALKNWAAVAMPQAAWLACAEASIRQMATPSVSERLLQRFATGSVSEALALHAAREHADSRLVLHRIVSADRHATLAIAGLPPHSLETGVLS